MLSVPRICRWIFFFLAILLPFSLLLGVVDELAMVMLGALGVTDCVVNRRWRQYLPFWIVVAILAIYIFYSILVVKVNTPYAVVYDAIVEAKPYVAFFVALAIAPTLTEKERKLGRICAIAYVAIALACYFLQYFGIDYSLWRALITHPFYLSTLAVCGSVLYLYCSYDRETGKIPVTRFATALLLLLTGLLSEKAKYFALLVVALYLFFIYKPGMFSGANARKALAGVTIVLGLVMVVTWNKFSFYFLGGSLDAFEVENLEDIARPMLYYGGLMVMTDYFPFGSGLASFASFASALPGSYSAIYARYGLDTVYGLRPENPNFVCDAFYPSLAQFGVVGIILFSLLWIYAIVLLLRQLRAGKVKFAIPFVCGIMIIACILIDSTTATTFSNAFGFFLMMLLGLICGQTRHLDPESWKREKRNPAGEAMRPKMIK